MWRWVSSACICLLASAMPSLAQQSTATVYTEISGRDLVALLRDEGYRAKLSNDDYGDPLIESSVGGSTFRIEFYNCDLGTPGYCEDVMFRIGYALATEIDLESINSWNEERRFSRAWRDGEGDPILEQDLDFAGGITPTHILGAVRLWEQSVGDFEEHIGW